MSRLDRIYASKSGEWLSLIPLIRHDSKAGISDHSPVILEVRTGDREEARRLWKTHLKFSVEELKPETVRRKADAAWRNHPPNVSDPRIMWDLAWRRIISVVKEERRVTKLQEVSREDLAKLMEEWRDKVETSNTTTNMEGFQTALQMLREKDEKEATLEQKMERQQVLRLIDKKVTPDGNRQLERKPTEEDLDDCIQRLTKDKASGLDGVSADVLRELWEEVKPLCVQMLDTVVVT
ncbi:hypothetical protein R1sor_021684 [Riccia sorocarpa]|uniref:Endonuclease/exonuclease/phosphatase domain-containing protein n=1 Tax=Riccia sorocarpa TaxID=122646 RepID=A0ABD3GIH4_9MARC